MTVFHAGTSKDPDGTLRTNGGRVLNVSAVAPEFAEAQQRSRAAAEAIRFEGKVFRRDIGWREAARDSRLDFSRCPSFPKSKPSSVTSDPSLLGRRFGRVTLSHDDVLRGVTRRRLLRRLRGASVHDVFRRAKHAVIDLGDQRLIVQPGMTGSLVVHDHPSTVPKSRDTPCSARSSTTDASSSTTMFAGSARCCCSILAGWDAYTSAIGPEPLERSFTAADLGAALAGSRQAIKKVIMDQRYLAGVGNIYANEALFAAGIDPSKPANTADAR